MAFSSLGRARWLALPLVLAGCGNRDQTHLFLSADPAPVVNPVRPVPTDDEPPLGAATRDAGVDAGAAEEPIDAPPEDAGGVASSGDAGLVAPEPPPLPAPVCERLQPDPNGVLTDVLVLDILPAQENDCRTALLLPGASENPAWGEYLFLYTYALLGCPEPELPPGGLDVFPLSNTGVEGVDSPPLAIGKDDADALIEQYLDALSVPLALTAGERAEFEAYLRYQAGKVVDPEVSGALSTCAP